MSGVALFALFALSACGGASSAATGPEHHEQPQNRAARADTPVTKPATDQLSQLDRNALEMAQAACKNQDFKTLLMAIAGSTAARQKYSAPSIEVSVLDAKGNVVSTRRVARTAYDDFPVRQVDFYYKPAKPTIAGDEDEYLDLQINESQTETFSVEWARVHYDGKSDGGDDLGNIIGLDGKTLPAGMHPDADGQLLFRPTSDCWQLEADTRWRR